MKQLFIQTMMAGCLWALTAQFSTAQVSTVQSEGSKKISLNDPKPQHYKLTARASDIDARVKAHPEIGFLIESKGKPADIQHASVDTRVAVCNRAYKKDGKFMREDVWRYMFTHPVDSVGSPVPSDASCIEDQQ